jgi:hypothetical protein
MVGDDTRKEAYSSSSYSNASLFQRAKYYIWRSQEYDNWADTLDLINGLQWRQTVLPQISQYSLHNGLLGGMNNGTRGSAAIQAMSKWWLMQHICADKDNLLDNLRDKYDTFVITRTGQYYSCPLFLSNLSSNNDNDLDLVYIPKGESYDGYCNRFQVTSHQRILESLDILPPFLNASDPKIYRGLHNPEGLLKAMELGLYKNLTVPRFPRVMWTCWSKGDKTRWSVSDDTLLEEGVFRKHPSKHDMGKQNCAHSFSNRLY